MSNDLATIIRRRHTGELSDCARLEMDAEALDRIVAAYPPTPGPPDPLMALTGIPIVVDPEMDAGSWRIVDRLGAVLYEGRA